MSTAKTPGQVAYEAAPFRIRDGFEDCLVDMPYEHLSSGVKAAFDKRAEAVIRMCAERLQQIGDKADARGDQEHSYYQSARFIEALIPAKNGGEG